MSAASAALQALSQGELILVLTRPGELRTLSYEMGAQLDMHQLHVSRSHAAGLEAMVLHQRHRVAIDIEALPAQNPPAAGQTRDDLLRWCATEAVLKAIGTGLAGWSNELPIQGLDVQPNAWAEFALPSGETEPLWLHDLERYLPVGHVGVVAVQGGTPPLRVWDKRR